MFNFIGGNSQGENDVSANETSIQVDENDGGAENANEVSLEDAFKLAKAHHRNGNLVIAERTYRDILRAVPDHFQSVFMLAALLFQRGSYDESAKFGKQATELEPENVSCWVNYASALSAGGDNIQAIEALDHAISIDPEAYEAYSNKAYALWLEGRYEEAEEMATQATMINSKSPDAYMNLGIALASQEKFSDAEEIWQELSEMQPENPKVYSNWSNSLRSQGKLELATQMAEKAIELAPESVEAINNQGCIYKEMGDFDQAVECFTKATSIKPDYFAAHNNLALTYINARQFDKAEVSAKYAVSFNKDSAETYSTLAVAQLRQAKLDEARASADKAMQLAPDQALHYLTLADVMLAYGNNDEAEALLNQALALEPTDVRTLLMMADVRLDLDMISEALDAVNQAISVFQETPPILCQKARILERASRVEEGLEVIEQALKLRPDNPTAMLTKADLLLTINRKDEAREVLENGREILKQWPAFYFSMQSYKTFDKDDEDFKALQAFYEKIDNYEPEIRSIIAFALFKAHEKMGEYDKAFEYLAYANKTKIDQRQFDKTSMGKPFQMQKQVFTKEVLGAHDGKGCDSNVPVFILGMPRSGTTLTEQIISSHPEVFGAGELYDLSAVIRELGPLTQDNAHVMGQGYVDKVMARTDGGAYKHITDKMPGNYMNVGLIRSILPNAKIIHCRRNPIDNCLSCLKQNFASGHDYAYDQEGMAIRYELYDDLMDYWCSFVPEDRILTVDYEETVGNFEEQAKKMISFIGLEWDDACLAPHKQKRAVLTASKNQVNKPVYTSSVDAWRRYEDQLKPLTDGLANVLEKRGIKI